MWPRGHRRGRGTFNWRRTPCGTRLFRAVIYHEPSGVWQLCDDSPVHSQPVRAFKLNFFEVGMFGIPTLKVRVWPLRVMAVVRVHSTLSTGRTPEFKLRVLRVHRNCHYSASGPQHDPTSQPVCTPAGFTRALGWLGAKPLCTPWPVALATVKERLSVSRELVP